MTGKIFAINAFFFTWVEWYIYWSQYTSPWVVAMLNKIKQNTANIRELPSLQLKKK